MKSLILAAMFTVFYTIAITVAFNIQVPRARAALMTKIFIASLPIFFAVHLATPADLWFIPASLVESCWWVDVAFGLFINIAGFFGGILQLYNLADRGLSLRMLIDMDESPAGSLSLSEVVAGYGGGRGIDWMYQKRLDGMREHGLIDVHGDGVSLTEKGMRAARFFGSLRSFLKLDTDNVAV